jgi:hypothetical protein
MHVHTHTLLISSAALALADSELTHTLTTHTSITHTSITHVYHQRMAPLVVIVLAVVSCITIIIRFV